MTERTSMFEIIPGMLYQRGQFIGMSLEHKLFLLRKYRIDSIANLWHTSDEELRPYLHFYNHTHFRDSIKEKELDKQWIFYYAKALSDMISRGHVLLVHCYSGKSRSGFLNSLIVRELYIMTGYEAMEHVRHCRKGSVNNRYYESILTELGKPNENI